MDTILLLSPSATFVIYMYIHLQVFASMSVSPISQDLKKPSPSGSAAFSISEPIVGQQWLDREDKIRLEI